jgi:hypothetical protein
MKNNKDIDDEIFSSFYNGVCFSDTTIKQISTVCKNQSVESKSVEVFGLSLTVFLEAF